MENCEVRELSVADAPRVWAVLSDDGGFSQRVEGRSPQFGDVEALFTTLPPNVDAPRKHVIGMFQDAALVAVADIVQGWPDDRTNYIGLLQVGAPHQGQGFAGHLHERIVSSYPASRWRLSVVGTNAQVIPFWRSLGYEPTGEEKPWFNAGGQQQTALIFERNGDQQAQ